MTAHETAVFVALADPTRRGVIELLAHGPMRAGELARATGMSAPAMSRHLRLLLAAGMIADERGHDARVRIFRLRPESLTQLRSWLDQLKQRWDEQLRSFQRLADRAVEQ